MKDSLILSNLFHRPARTAVSVFGIAIGVLLIVFTVGLADGSLRESGRREANVGAEILVRASGSIGLSGTDAFRLPLADAAEIEKIAGVGQVVPVGQNLAAAKDGITGSRMVEGINFDQYVRLSGIKIVRGRAFADGADEVIVDTAWLEQRRQSLNSKIQIYDRDFTIVGTFEPIVGGRVKMPLSTMQNQLGGEGKCTGFYVKVADGVKPETVMERIAARFPDAQIIPTKEIEEIYANAIPAVNVFLDVVVGVAAIVAALIVLLTMYTTVTERTRQIGIMKSLGMSKAEIAWTITQEALLISFLGAALGIFLTFCLRLVVINTTTLQVTIERRLILITVLICLIGGAIGALYPALRAASLDAVEALSYE
jgi:putative ABC transport system permease protein